MKRLQKFCPLKQNLELKPNLEQLDACSRCFCELGKIINRGAFCPVCRKKVCKNCRSTGQDLNLWVCFVCGKKLQLKSSSGKWMKEFTRSASEKIKSPNTIIAAATENFGRSLKYSFRSAGLLRQVADDSSLTSNSKLKSFKSSGLVKGFVLPKLSNAEGRPHSQSSESSGSLDSSPKPPLSPVIKIYQAAADFVDSTRSNSPSSQSEQTTTVYRKVSNKLLDSSSSSEEELVDDCGQQFSKAKISENKNEIRGHTYPRTLNSAKILSSIANKQATAFQFPPIGHRSLSEKASQSFEDSSNSFNFRSSKDESQNHPLSFVPVALPRTRKINQLRKQKAVAEEHFSNDLSEIKCFSENFDVLKDSITKSNQVRERKSNKVFSSSSSDIAPSLDENEQDLEKSGYVFKNDNLKFSEKSSSSEDVKLNKLGRFKTFSQGPLIDLDKPASIINLDLSHSTMHANLTHFKSLSLSRASHLNDLKLVPSKLFKLNLPARMKFRKLIKKSKMIKDHMLICLLKFRKKSNELRNLKYNSIKLNQPKQFSLASHKSASLPNQNHLKYLKKRDVINFKYSSLDERDSKIDKNLERLKSHTLNLNKSSDDKQKYQLVFIDQTSKLNNSPSDIHENYKKCGSSYEANFQKDAKSRLRILRVRSHFEISDGTTYIEDSDWEMCSDPGEISLYDESSQLEYFSSNEDEYETEDEVDNVVDGDHEDDDININCKHERHHDNNSKANLCEQKSIDELSKINFDGNFYPNHKLLFTHSVFKLFKCDSRQNQLSFVNQVFFHNLIDQILLDLKPVDISFFNSKTFTIDNANNINDFDGIYNKSYGHFDSFDYNYQILAKPFYFILNHDWFELNCHSCPKKDLMKRKNQSLDCNFPNQIDWKNPLVLELNSLKNEKTQTKRKENDLAKESDNLMAIETNNCLEFISSKRKKQVSKNKVFNSQKNLENYKNCKFKILNLSNFLTDINKFGLRQIKFDSKDNSIFFDILEKKNAIFTNKSYINSFGLLLQSIYLRLLDKHYIHWLSSIQFIQNQNNIDSNWLHIIAIFKFILNITIKEKTWLQELGLVCFKFWEYFINTLVNEVHKMDKTNVRNKMNDQKNASSIFHFGFIQKLTCLLEKLEQVVFCFKTLNQSFSFSNFPTHKNLNENGEKKLKSIKELKSLMNLRKCGTGIVDDEASSTTQIFLKQTKKFDFDSTNSSLQTRSSNLKLDFHSSFFYFNQSNLLQSTSPFNNNLSSFIQQTFSNSYPTHHFYKKCDIEYQYSSKLISSILNHVEIDLDLSQNLKCRYALDESEKPDFVKFHTCLHSAECSEMSDFVQNLSDEENSFNSFNDDLDCLEESFSSLEDFYSQDNYDNVSNQSGFGNPVVYSLHTIIEESCEESEQESLQSVCESEKINSDFEKFEIGHNLIQKEGSFTESDDNEENLSEISETLEDIDRLHMASSRLEKYFTTGLLGSKTFQYPDDVEFLTDSESQEAKSDLVEQYNQFLESKLEEPEKVNISEFLKSNYDQNQKKIFATTLYDDKNLQQVQKAIKDKNSDNDQINSDECPTSSPKIESNLSLMTSMSKSEEMISEKKETKMNSNLENESFKSGQNSFINKVLSKLTSMPMASKSKFDFIPPLKALEAEIAFLMKVVSPVNVSSENDPFSFNNPENNNSDYGSDILESTDCSSDDEKGQSFSSNGFSQSLVQKIAENYKNSDKNISEDTAQIYKQLMSSLEQLTQVMRPNETSQSLKPENENNITKVKSYIRSQIVNLMQNVDSSSRQDSPKKLKKKDSKIMFTSADKSSLATDNVCYNRDESERSFKNAKESHLKCELESSSETISAKVSIPSYNDSDNAPTECEVSHKMEKLFTKLSNTVNKNKHQSLFENDKNSPKSGEAKILLFSNGRTKNELSHSKTKAIINNNTIKDKLFESSPTRNITVNGKNLNLDEAKSKFKKEEKVKDLESLNHKTIVKIEDVKQIESVPLPFEFKDRSFSSDSVSSIQTVKSQTVNAKNSPISEIILKESQTSLKFDDESVDEKNNSSHLYQADGGILNSPVLQKTFNAKEESSNENNYLSANVCPQLKANSSYDKMTFNKTAGNVLHSERNLGKKTCHNTDYYHYSFKSSEENITSLKNINDYSVSLKIPKSAEEKNEVEKIDSFKCRFPSTFNNAKTYSLSPNLAPEKLIRDSKPNFFSSYVKNNTTPQIITPIKTKSSIFSTSKILRKLLHESQTSSFKSQTKSKITTSESEPCRSKGHSKLPYISISDYSQDSFQKESIGSIGNEAFSSQEDIGKAFECSNNNQFRSESLSSVYSAAGGGRFGIVEVSGEIFFSVSYNYIDSTLDVHVKECRNLSPVDRKRNRSDPYVKLYLLPDHSKSGKRKTKIKKHTLNPVFDEILRFNLSKENVEKRTLWVSVWHSDIFGRNDFLGELNLPLSAEVFKNTGLKWYPLQERIDLMESTFSQKGDLFIALKFVPSNNSKTTKGELLALIKEAHNLMPTRSNGTSDPFCKSYLLPDRSKANKQKTPVIKKTCNPRWNHTFVFQDISLDELKERCLEVTIWDYDKLTSNDFLGGVKLSLGNGKIKDKELDWMDSMDEEINLWKQMLERPNMWVYGELCLRPTFQTRQSS